MPLTLVIAGMLVLLVLSYTQVIAAHPEGGGAYAVAKLNLGRPMALLGAASLVVDYVLTVAVSLAAGAASLGSVFPGLAHHLLAILHNQRGRLLETVLKSRTDVIVATLPFHVQA